MEDHATQRAVFGEGQAGHFVEAVLLDGLRLLLQPGGLRLEEAVDIFIAYKIIRQYSIY